MRAFSDAIPRPRNALAISAGIVLIVVLVPVGFAGWARARRRKESTRAFRLSLVLLAAAAVPILTGVGLDSPERAVRRAQPVVDAIRRHVAEQGAPPETLRGLVPKYLDEVPDALTRTFRVARYERDAARPAGFALEISGVVGLSSQWLDYEPGDADPKPGPSFDRSRAPRRIGDWVWNEATF
jgi:hypothetical protein